MGATAKAPKSFKKFVSKKLPKILKKRPKQRLAKRQMKERAEKREKRDQDEAVAEEERHKQTIQSLQQHDPELHKYLEENEPDVLRFGEDFQAEDEEEDGDEAEAADFEMEAEAPVWQQDDLRGSGSEAEAEEEGAEAGAGLTAAGFAQWLLQRRLKMVCLAFRAAVALYEGDDERVTNTPAPWRVTDYELANAVVAGAFKQGASMLNYHCRRTAKAERTKLPHECAGYEKVKNLAKAFLCSAARALTHVTEPTLLAGLLNSCVPLVPYLAPWGTLKKLYLKRFLTHVTHELEAVRFQAFLNIREMAKAFRYPFTDLCMKGMFLTLARNTKFFNRSNLALVAFLMNCVVVLWGEDITAAYQQAFVYIRQLAIYLRTALKSPSQENFRLVYHWQFVNSYRCLAMVVCQYLRPNELWPLVYPLCQIGTGVLDLFPSPKCFPLHLNIVGILNRIAKASGVFIPVPPYLLRIIASPELRKKYKRASAGTAPDLVVTLRAKTAAMASVVHHTAILQEALYYLVEHLALHAHAIGFPELAYPALADLAATRKRMQMREWSAEVRDTVREVERNVAFIRDRRKAVTFGPKDADKVAVWETEAKAAGPPLLAYFEELHKARAEQMQAQGRVHATQKRRVLEEEMEKAKGPEDDDEEEEDDGAVANGREEDEEMEYSPDEAEDEAPAPGAKGRRAERAAEAEEDTWEDTGKRGGRRKHRK